jgi:hypothetical protein
VSTAFDSLSAMLVLEAFTSARLTASALDPNASPKSRWPSELANEEFAAIATAATAINVMASKRLDFSFSFSADDFERIKAVGETGRRRG